MLYILYKYNMLTLLVMLNKKKLNSMYCMSIIVIKKEHDSHAVMLHGDVYERLKKYKVTLINLRNDPDISFNLSSAVYFS